MTTLIAEPKDYSEKAIAAYKSLGPVYLLPKLEGKKRDEILRQANIIVLRLAYKIDASWMDKMPNLKVIATPTTGLNHVDVAEAKKRGIKIICLRGRTSFLKYIPSTAEKTMALLMASVRKLPWAFDHVREGGWDRNLFKGNQLLGKTLGIIGFGRLGKIVAKYARVFGMDVVACDPHLAPKVFSRYGVRRVSMEELFKRSDIVSVHASLTNETTNLIKEKHFRLMKPTAHLINTARGEIVDEKALLKALKNKWMAGAALDVVWNEAGDGSHLKGNPLLAYARENQNLLIVPHLGGATYEAMQVTEDFIADLVKKYIKK
ncbi:MAG: hypothetical protein HYT03_01205 [Candidatus Harrisonbacteria bacterium]|nr:hypothetical protein [Candidatus Harrisonbacteria bacterium]